MEQFRKAHTFIQMYKNGQNPLTSNRQIWHTNMRTLYIENILKSPRYCARIYRGIMNKAAVKGHEQSQLVHWTQSKEMKTNANQSLIEFVSD